MDDSNPSIELECRYYEPMSSFRFQPLNISGPGTLTIGDKGVVLQGYKATLGVWPAIRGCATPFVILGLLYLLCGGYYLDGLVEKFFWAVVFLVTVSVYTSKPKGTQLDKPKRVELPWSQVYEFGLGHFIIVDGFDEGDARVDELRLRINNRARQFDRLFNVRRIGDRKPNLSDLDSLFSGILHNCEQGDCDQVRIVLGRFGRRRQAYLKVTGGLEKLAHILIQMRVGKSLADTGAQHKPKRGKIRRSRSNKK